MSIYNRINAIQMRMQEVQARFGSVQTPAVSMPPMAQRTSPTSGTSFAQLLGSMSQEPGAGTAAGGDYSACIRNASQRWGVDESLIRAVITQESGGDAQATSHCGAQGLMQLMPETAKSLGVTDPYNPEQNIMGGARYLRSMLDRFKGDVSLALAAYNAGPGAVQQYGGVPPYAETQNYVASVMSHYRRYRGESG